MASRLCYASSGCSETLRGRPQRWMRFGSFSMTMSESLQLCWMHEWCCFSKAATRPWLVEAFCLNWASDLWYHSMRRRLPVLPIPLPVACGMRSKFVRGSLGIPSL